jgi:hypothetical protein
MVSMMMEKKICVLFSVLALVAATACSGGGGEGDADGDADTDAIPDADIDPDPDGADGVDPALDPGEDLDAPWEPDGEWIDPPTTTITLTSTDEVFLNPERGFYRSVNLITGSNYDRVREEGSTVAHSYARLDDYRDRDIEASFLADLETGFAGARAAGIKIIFRCAYNFGPYPDSEPDASKDWILRHLEQLEPVLQANADVIAVMQAGFIGAWGEWHTSTNHLLDDPQDKFDILEAILAALPAERMVQLRYPPYKDEGYGGPLTAADAYGGTSAARIGHHNDCFLASDTDWGTWPGDAIEQWKEYVAQDTLYVTMGGETCNLNAPRSDCSTALAEMERFHYSYINNDYHPDVVAGWETQGCREEMERRLGYRFSVGEVTYAPEAPPGGVLPLTLQITNEGWAAPYNPRPLRIVLDGASRHEADAAAADVRWWMAGEAVELGLRLQLPSDLEPGTYTLALWLPDAAEGLQDDGRYSIRLANEGVWDEARGFNILAEVTIDPSAPGSVRDDAEGFYVIE